MGAGCASLNEARQNANGSFARGNYDEALGAYTEILDKVEDAKVYSNRCATYLYLNKPRLALLDAFKVVELDPTWHKGYFRMGCALAQLEVPNAAVLAFALCPDDEVKARKEEALAASKPSPWRGNAYAWGETDGLSIFPKAIAEMKGSLVVDCAAGMAHTVAVTQEGHVFAWGLNTTLQCGIAGIAEVAVPRIVLRGRKVIAIACGAGHTVCLTEEGKALGWGLGANGQLGIGTLAKENMIVDVGTPDERTWRGVACGFAHTMLVDASCDLYGCGWNVQGQVGTSEDAVESCAGVCVPFLRRIACSKIGQVACGGVHTVAVAIDGPVWAWGANHCGQIGDGTTHDAFIPRTCTFSKETNIVLATCGEEFTFAISAQRQVFAWGLNNVRQLLLVGDCVLVPQHVDVLAEAKIEWIVSAQGSSLALTEDGSLLKWGNHVDKPSRFDAVKNVALVKCGRRHFIATCKVPDPNYSFCMFSKPGPFRVKQHIEVQLSLDGKPAMGMPLSYTLLDLDTHKPAGGTIDLWDDTLTVISQEVGFFELHVLLGLTPLKNSPLLLEVHAGEIDFNTCSCTLKSFPHIPVGTNLRFYVFLKDRLGNFCVGAGEHITIEGAPPGMEVTDVGNGVRVTLCWSQMGIKKVVVGVCKGDVAHILQESQVEVTPGMAHAPEWLTTGEWSQMAGVPFSAVFELRDRFGNRTEEVGDMRIRVDQDPVAVTLPPRRTLDPYAPWTPPLEEHCALGIEVELYKVGTYHVEWTTEGASARKQLTISHGPPHPYRSRLGGLLNMVVPDPHVSQAWTLNCFDAYDNPCVLGASSVEITVERWPGGAPIAQSLTQKEHCYACTVAFTEFGEYHIFARVDGVKVLGSPFSITVTEDLEVAEQRRQAALEASALIDAERRRLDEELARQRQQRVGTPELQKLKSEVQVAEALEAKQKEVEKAKREARVRERALEALRKTQADMRAKRLEKKEKRVGGGFIVKFENRDKK